MTDLSLLLGAAIFASGMLAGRFWPARRKAPKPLEPVKPICGCSHHLAHHDPDGDGGGGACQAGIPMGREIERCACQRYVGPRILDPGYVARELSEG